MISDKPDSHWNRVYCIWWGGLPQWFNHTAERCRKLGGLEHSPQLINAQRSAALRDARRSKLFTERKEKKKEKKKEKTARRRHFQWIQSDVLLCNILCHEHVASPSQSPRRAWSRRSRICSVEKHRKVQTTVFLKSLFQSAPRPRLVWFELRTAWIRSQELRRLIIWLDGAA